MKTFLYILMAIYALQAAIRFGWLLTGEYPRINRCTTGDDAWALVVSLVYVALCAYLIFCNA